MALVLGVDGGNTKTIALVARGDGTIVGAGRAGCSDIYGARTADAAVAEVERAVEIARSPKREAIAAACFSMAGADWPEDVEFLCQRFARLAVGRVRVVNDAIGALRGAATAGPTVAVICGTGAAIGARGENGALWHSSFWQETQGGRHLAQKTLRAVYRAELGIDPPTGLTQRVLSAFGKASVEEVLHAFTGRVVGRPALDPLARVVLDAAAAGDATARRIVEEHGAALGDYALAAARRVGLDGRPFVLALGGNVLRHASPLLRDAIVARVASRAPLVDAVSVRFEPAVGALLLALEDASVAVDDAVLTRIEDWAAPAGLFST